MPAALLSPPLSPVDPTDIAHVLLLLDAQQCVLSDPQNGGIPDVDSARKNIRTILDIARQAHPPPRIIHVRNAGDLGDNDEPGTPGWQLIFSPLPSEIVIDKRKNNAFAGTNLGDIVPKHAEIIVVGFQTDFSIRATCSAALGRGNEVILIRGAHKTYPRIEVLNGGGVTEAGRVEAEIEAELDEAGVHIFEMKEVKAIFQHR